MSHLMDRLRGTTVLFALAVLGSLLVARIVTAQTTQTGSIAGTTRLNDGTTVSGVAVRVSSPALQGERVTYTGENGRYVLRGLPPGLYLVSFEMAGMSTVRSEIGVDLGQITRADATLSIALNESIDLTAGPLPPLTTAQLGSNMSSEEIAKLPLPRTLSGIAALSPGVSTNTFNPRQIRINGATGFDSIFLVDGTDINDTLFGLPNNLYIEDAIAEVQVLTAGIPADYGRFTGGVVNVITKSGGNRLTGTARVDLTSPRWVSVTGFERSRGVRHDDQISEVFSATLGGPFIRDRLWFFLAGRQQKTSEHRTLVETSIPYTFGVDNPRHEAKLTATPAPNHTIQGSWLDNPTQQHNTVPLVGRTMDPRALAAWRLPNRRWTLAWNGIFATSLFGEVKYAQKAFAFHDKGGMSPLITDSPFLTANEAFHYNAPYFDSSDPEDRDNENLTIAISWFADSDRHGSHDLKAGIDDYTSSRTGGNSPSATGYVFATDFVRDSGGRPALDANGRYIPNFVPGTSRVIRYFPTRGARVDTNTRSLFLSDHWTLNRYLSFTLGARFERVSGEATGGITTVDTERLTPRLVASWDVRGDARQKVDVTFGQYSGRYQEGQFGINTDVANPSSVTMVYTGPAGQGIGFIPGLDVANYRITGGNFPLQNVRVDPGIQSALVDEWTISGTTAIGSTGFARLAFVNRKWSDLWEDYLDTTTGTTDVVVSPTITRTLNNIYYGNSSASWREYRALQLLAGLRPFHRWNIQTAWTYELRNHGNLVGEGPNRTAVGSAYGDYPELFDEQRHYPAGRLPGYQEHRLRILNTWDQPLGAFGTVNAGLIYSFDSGGVYSLSTNVPLTAIQSALHKQAGYRSTPVTQTIYFGKLGSGEFEDVQQIDLALTWSAPVFRSLAPMIKLDVYNLLNAGALVAYNTTVTADPNSPKDALGLPTGYVKGPLFGKPTSVTTLESAGHVQLPREIRIAAGIRF